MKPFRLLAFCLLLLPGWLGAQYAQSTHFTIALDTVQGPQPSDYVAARSLGFVYAQPIGNTNVASICLGGFKNYRDAESLLPSLKATYPKATVVSRSLAGGRPLHAVQLSSKPFNEPIDWDHLMKVGDLYAVLDGNNIHIIHQVYDDPSLATRKAYELQLDGYPEASVRLINSVQLIAVGDFEMNYKPAFIPIASAGGRSERSTAARNSENPTELPVIRNTTRRMSIFDLQLLLREKGYLLQSPDGIYSPETARAYEDMVNEDKELIKYSLLAEAFPVSITNDYRGDALEEAILDLPDNNAALITIRSSSHPLANAYYAYYLFRNNGSRAEVNRLMNQALRNAYANKAARDIPVAIDLRTNYAYSDLSLLITHIYYLHLASGQSYIIPCWLIGSHAYEAEQARADIERDPTNTLSYETCDPFMEWPEIQLLYAIASDLNDEDVLDQNELKASAVDRAKLYLADSPVTALQLRQLDNWRSSLFDEIKIWSAKDPVLQRIGDALKLTFLHAQIRLEAYYVQQSFTDEEARGLALATLDSIVGYHLARFAD